MKKILILILLLFFGSFLYFKLNYTLVGYNENNKITKSKLFILDGEDNIFLYGNKYNIKNIQLSDKFTGRQEKPLNKKILLGYSLFIDKTLDPIIDCYSNFFGIPKTLVKNNEKFYYWIDNNSILVISTYKKNVYLRLFDLRNEYYSPGASPDTTIVVCEYLTCNNIEGLTNYYIEN